MRLIKNQCHSKKPVVLEILCAATNHIITRAARIRRGPRQRVGPIGLKSPLRSIGIRVEATWWLAWAVPKPKRRAQAYWPLV